MQPPLRARIAPIAPLLLALAGAACSGSESQPREGGTAPPVAMAGVEVTTALVLRGEIAQRISAPGTLAALRESRIGTEVRGLLQEIFVSEGDRVEAGDPLFQIDPEPYELALRQAKAGLDLAQAERRQKGADLKRARALLGKDVVSRQEVDRMQTTVAVAQAQERQAAEAVALAELNLRRTLVHAPYAGAVAERLADEGTTALAQPQTIVVVLQETHRLEGRATIPETHLANIAVGDRARIHVEGIPEPFETRISSVGDVVDRATRTYEVKMELANPEHRLKAGVFAHVEILPEPKQNVLLVPRTAIRSEEGRTRVLTVRDGLAVAVPVELGLVSPESAEVLGGLEPGQQVIVGEAAQTIAPGMAVRVLGESGETS
jgi:RND family efflux transporter MFP subunit